MLRIADMLTAQPTEMWELARQLGVKEAVCNLPYSDPSFDYADFHQLKEVVERFSKFGFRVTVIEGAPPNEKIKLGLPGRDEEIDRFSALIENMGKLGIDIMCYNFMPVLGWFRNEKSISSRGGALVTGYSHALMQNEPLTWAGEVSAEKMWENYEYFIRRTLPVAEKANVKMALHPDDPPITPIRGISRIFISADDFARALSLSDSPNHGITFCQGCFATMGEDIPDAIRRFGRERVFFVHFRDVVGNAAFFQETFHDAGKTDMREALKTYLDVGVDAPIRVDHVPTMAGEDNSKPGYMFKGRLYAIGYLRGLLEGLGQKSR